MEYRFRDIEKKWQQKWKEGNVYQVNNNSVKPKCYVLDMFPYPSGAGLHVGHPLGYIASDIYSRYKRLKGFNVLHPMGYDAFGLPAEQYAIDHGIHPAVSTETNINNFRRQLDNIGFSFDWNREVRTSDPAYYKWTQWIFLQLFKSFYNRNTNKAEPLQVLIAAFEKEGNINHPMPNVQFSFLNFSADEWNGFEEKTQQDILMNYRLAYCGYGEVNWCEALGTVLANDEVINGVSERGGYPVVKKKLRQWYLRITEYADRLLEGLDRVDFSEAMKEMQTNWIGKSSGAEIDFEVTKPPLTPPKGEDSKTPKYQAAQPSLYSITKKLAEEKRKEPTPEEEMMWQLLRGNKTGFHIRRQHIIGSYIVDFACLDKLATIEIDGGYHKNPEIKFYDEERTRFLKENGFTEFRFSNEEVRQDAAAVVKKITEKLSRLPSVVKESGSIKVSSSGGDLEGASKLRVYTTRPDTIFGVDFMVIAPEHELAEQLTTAEHKVAVEEYIAYVKSRSERERMAEKKITGIFTGSYAINPFNGRQIPVWISEYVLAGYGTGAIMGVPCGDERDHKFARHFNIPITNIIGSHYNGEDANPTKDAILENSDFISGMLMKDAIDVVINKLEELGIGVRKVNYKMRDAAFSRQRYWGEPFPIVWQNGIAYPLDESYLPLTLPEVKSYTPGPDGEGPLANITDWAHQYEDLTPHGGVLETNTMPGYAGSSWYFLRYMDPHNNNEFCSRAASDYWGQVDLYIGGTEHAVGHLLYSRMWTKCLFDLNLIGHDEPYKRLVNQGMIQGSSRFVYRVNSKGVENLVWEILSEEFPEYEFRNDSDSRIDFVSHKKQIAIEVKDRVDIDGNDLKKYHGPSTQGYQFSLISSADILSAFINGTLVQFLRNLLRNNISYLSSNKGRVDYFVSLNKADLFAELGVDQIHVDVNIVDGVELDIDAFRKWRNGEYADAILILEDASIDSPLSSGRGAGGEANADGLNDSPLSSRRGVGGEVKYICGVETEKMSKSKFNTVNPDDLVAKYGADTFRMYEMFLGPVEMSKPWDTKGIEGVHRFLKKFWRLFADEIKGLIVSNDEPSAGELKVLHHAIRKIENDTDRFSFNTGVSSFMIATNELTDLKCHKKKILEPLLILLAPYAPHIAEELWSLLDHEGSILDAAYPVFEEKYVRETTKAYPVAVNGKTRTELTISLDATQQQVEAIVMADETVRKWLENKAPKKIIYVKNKMINVVV